MERREVLKKGKPLTLEQLREMDGQPVYVERNEEPHDGNFAIGVSTGFTTFPLQEGEWYTTPEAAETALKERESR